MVKLTYVQRKDLEALTRRDSAQTRRGRTNPTLSALERRGLVERYFPNHDASKPLRWRITAVGRAWL